MVAGLSSAELDTWRDTPATDSSWTRAFRVMVADAETPFAGRYAVSDTAVEFTPAYRMDRGRRYDVVVEAARLSSLRPVALVHATVGLPGGTLASTTRVTRVLPALDVLPENQLRLYIEFSAPMSREAGLPFVHLRTSKGDSVGAAFLPVDGDFWNADRTRYTLFLDPGRVKRGILPNEQMGRPLRKGERYTLHVDSTWRDGRGAPLAAPFTYSFLAGDAELRPLSLGEWTVAPPPAGTTTPCVVRFPRPLDHGLLHRALGIYAGAGGDGVRGLVEVADGGREWRFTPARAWAAGDYRLVVLSILEDLAGNRINRAFEADRFDRADSTSTVPSFAIPFVVR